MIDEKPIIAKNKFANLDTTQNPGTTSITSPEFNLRYWGMYSDPESKLFYNGRRSYRPDDGEYTQNDPIGLGGGLNRRTTAEGNLLRATDPTGLLECKMTGLVLEGNWGPPPSLDPDNPYGRGAPPSPGLRIPEYTLPGAIIGACQALGNWMFSGADSGVKIDDKIRGQLGDRGWTEQDVQDAAGGQPSGTTTDNRRPIKTPAGLGRKDEPASVYGSKDGYVVVNDRTREVVQVSDRTPGSGWLPDRRIIWK